MHFDQIENFITINFEDYLKKEIKEENDWIERDPVVLYDSGSHWLGYSFGWCYGQRIYLSSNEEGISVIQLFEMNWDSFVAEGILSSDQLLFHLRLGFIPMTLQRLIRKAALDELVFGCICDYLPESIGE